MLGAHRVESSDSRSVVYGESFGRHIARDAAVVHRFLGCDKRILNEQIGLARGHLIEKIGGIVILDLCGELVFYIVGGEARRSRVVFPFIPAFMMSNMNCG